MAWWWRKRSIGERGEDAAARHLKRYGYKILARNAQLGRYEIDIIARKDDTIAFVEVKTKTTDVFAAPEENVDYKKRQRIRRAAHHFIAQHDEDGVYYRFDVASVLIPLDGRPEVTLYPNAFEDR
jgi:putative endonuclease